MYYVIYTRRGRSRVRHVRHREADMEQAQNSGRGLERRKFGLQFFEAERPSRTREQGVKRRAFICSSNAENSPFLENRKQKCGRKCTIDFSYPTSYSTSIVLGGLRRLLLSILRRHTTSQWQFFTCLVVSVTKVLELLNFSSRR